MSSHRFALFAFIAALNFCTSTLPGAPVKNGRIAKPVCLMQPEGCPCYSGADQKNIATRIYHNEALIEAGEAVAQLTPVARYTGHALEKNAAVCYYPTAALRWQPEAVDHVLSVQKLDHRPLPLEELFLGLRKEDALQTVSSYKKASLGKFWFTYYHLALEEHHPGPKVPVLSPQGKVIGHTSQEFQKQVRWQGSGIADDGTKYHYSGIQGRYHIYDEEWGMGAGRGYEVFPYRTIAVNFKGFCSRLYPNDGVQRESCRRGGVLGIAVFMPEVAARNVKMEDGSVHDGWFCATDTGAPTHIKEDRIDIFVGAHGGGNPYLPASRQWNSMYAAGLRNSVQWDWRLWQTETQRIWCDLNRLPKEGEAPDPKRHCLHDFHTTTPEKAVTMQVAFTPSGELLRCRTGRQIRELRKR